MRRDRPTAWIVPDRTLLEIARRRPTTAGQLAGERGLPERMRQSDLDGILRAIAEGAAAEPIHLPAAPGAELQARMDTLGPLGQILVTARAAEADLAPSLVATRDEIETFLWGEIGAREVPDSPLADRLALRDRRPTAARPRRGTDRAGARGDRVRSCGRFHAIRIRDRSPHAAMTVAGHMPHERTRAVIDMGSNSFRLVIYRYVPGALVPARR